MMQPSAEFLSVSPGIVTTLHLLTLTLHFAAMGLVFGGIGALWLARAEGKWERPTARRLVALFPSLMAATVTLGVAPLLFLQLVFHRQVYAAAIVSAWYWLGIVGAVIAAYYLLYACAMAGEAGQRFTPLRLALACALLAYVSLVYSAVFTLAETPGTIAAAWAAGPVGGTLHPDLGRWLPRWLHMVAGALTLGAFGLAVIARDDDGLFAPVKTVYLGGMVAAILLGFGALFGLGEDLAPYMRSTAVWWMLASLLLALGSLHFTFRKRFAAGGALLFVSLFAMVAQRHVARLVVLERAGGLQQLPVVPQWGPFALFLVCFVAMLGAGAWMLRLFFRSDSRPDAA